MEIKEVKKIESNAILNYGVNHQIFKIFEEVGEMISAMARHENREKNRDNLIEEIADVEVMIDQAKIIYACEEEVAKVKEEKLIRLVERMKNGQ